MSLTLVRGVRTKGVDTRTATLETAEALPEAAIAEGAREKLAAAHADA